MIRLTFEVFQEPALPDQWAARCVELNILSAATSPEGAFEALAGAVRMTVGNEADRSGMPITQAFTAIATRVKLAFTVSEFECPVWDTRCKVTGQELGELWPILKGLEARVRTMTVDAENQDQASLMAAQADLRRAADLVADVRDRLDPRKVQ